MRTPFITEEVVAKRKRGRPGQDVHSLATRLKAWVEREARRAATLARLKSGKRFVADPLAPPLKDKRGRIRRYKNGKPKRGRMEEVKIEDDWGVILISGEKGSGKSLLAAAIALDDWCNKGRLVFSNLGFEFGYQISANDLYAGIVGMPPNSTLIIDEAHQPLSNIGASSHKMLSVRQMLAGLRKINSKVILLSSQPDNIDGRILEEVDRAYKPVNTYPGENKTYNAQGKKAFAGKPWLWRELRGLGNHPYKRRKGRASDVFAAFGMRLYASKVNRIGIRFQPHELWEASKAYDSFAPLINPLLAGMGITSQDVKTNLANDEPWIDFLDEDDLAAQSSPEEAQTQRAVQAYEAARQDVFINALWHQIASYKRKGTYGVLWAANQATEICANKKWKQGEQLLDDMMNAYYEVPEHRRPEGPPDVFSDNDANYYLGVFCGARNREFTIDRFLAEAQSRGARNPYDQPAQKEAA